MEHLDQLHETALKLSQRLGDKFDFSDDKNYSDWAKLSYKAAKAFMAEKQLEESKLKEAKK